MSTIGYSSGGSTLPISALQCCPRRVAPEVVDVEEAAREQVVAQAVDLEVVEADGADVGHETKGQEKSRSSVARTTTWVGSPSSSRFTCARVSCASRIMKLMSELG